MRPFRPGPPSTLPLACLPPGGLAARAAQRVLEGGAGQAARLWQLGAAQGSRPAERRVGPRSRGLGRGAVGRGALGGSAPPPGRRPLRLGAELGRAALASEEPAVAPLVGPRAEHGRPHGDGVPHGAASITAAITAAITVAITFGLTFGPPPPAAGRRASCAEGEPPAVRARDGGEGTPLWQVPGPCPRLQTT